VARDWIDASGEFIVTTLILLSYRQCDRNPPGRQPVRHHLNRVIIGRTSRAVPSARLLTTRWWSPPKRPTRNGGPGWPL